MQSMTLRCTLHRCNIDGSIEMSLDKCVLNANNESGRPSPCYYLHLKVNHEDAPDDAWKKFNSFVGYTKKKSAPGNS